jgi:hypothetical protein
MTEPRRPAHTVLPETRAIALVGCFDLLITFFLIATHRAQEANPLMSSVFTRYGPAGLALLKAAFLAVPLTIAECARSRSPLFVPKALRVGLALYMLLLLFAYRQPLLALVHL